MAHAKWDVKQHMLFVHLCEDEVRKGNRPNTTLSKQGWENVTAAFNEKFPVNYTRKQFKNHWDAMKGEWKLFTKLRRGHTGLGWNEATKSIDATDEWWDARIKEDDKYSKFRGVDLSLYWFSYDTLFSDIVATGQRARAPNQQSTVGEQQSAIGEELREGSGDSDEELRENNLFPDSYASQKQGSSGTKRKKSGAEIIRDSLEGVMKVLACKSKSTASTAAVDNSLNEAIDILDAMEEIEFMSSKYHFAATWLTRKENRIIWFKCRSNAQRASTINYNYEQHVRNGGS